MSDTNERIQVQTDLKALGLIIEHSTALLTNEIGHVKASVSRIELGSMEALRRIETLEREHREGMAHCASHDPRIDHTDTKIEHVTKRVEALEEETAELRVPRGTNDSTLVTLLKNPATVYAFALVLVTIMAIVMASALTGRDANGLVPNLRNSQPTSTFPGDPP